VPKTPQLLLLRWEPLMDKFGVPCPRCGSVRVIVGGRAEGPMVAGSVVGDGKAHVPQLHRCACEDCRHTFHHDLAFCE
jgi:hypothetical protein